jgi:hypothetical protein
MLPSLPLGLQSLHGMQHRKGHAGPFQYLIQFPSLALFDPRSQRQQFEKTHLTLLTRCTRTTSARQWLILTLPTNGARSNKGILAARKVGRSGLTLGTSSSANLVFEILGVQFRRGGKRVWWQILMAPLFRVAQFLELFVNIFSLVPNKASLVRRVRLFRRHQSSSCYGCCTIVRIVLGAHGQRVAGHHGVGTGFNGGMCVQRVLSAGSRECVVVRQARPSGVR